MVVLIPMIMMILISSTSCVTATHSDIPICEPEKVYPAINPPVCKPVKKAEEYKCPKTKRIGTPYTDIDEANFNVAKRRCPELFPSSPCLKVFAKTEAYTYTAICGAASSGGGEKVVNWKDRSR